MTLYLINLNLMLFAKFGWSGSREEDFQIFQCILLFHNYLPLVEIGPVVLQKIFKICQCILLFLNYLPLEKNGAIHLNKLSFPSPYDALYQVWLKLAQWFWRRKWKCEKFTDRWTDDRRQANKKAHLSFQLRWAKK